MLAAALVMLAPFGSARAQLLGVPPFSSSPQPSSGGIIPPRPNELPEQEGQTSRRELLERLVRERGVEIDWRDEALAEESVPDRIGSDTETDVRRVLEYTNYVVLYEDRGNERRMSRVIVFGSGHSVEQPVPAAPNSSRRRSVGQELVERRTAERRAEADAARRQRAIAAAQRRRQAAQD
jgi:hypothetical protein